MSQRRVVLIAVCGVAIGAAVVGYYLHGQRRSPSPGPAPQSEKLASATAALHATPEDLRRALWVLSIGVNRYNESTRALQFAEDDARAFADELQAQRDLPLYRKVETLVLTNEQVTRETIINGIKTFLGKAGPDDVATIFMAGHGVQDPVTGSYYFLPYPATAENLDTEGLRMSDFDEMIKRLQQNVHSIAVFLDTCHAGAVQLPSSRATRDGEDLAAGINAAEGLYVLAAAKKGEESFEEPALGHGAFTYALLEGLHGQAAHEGLIYLTDLFRYVARQVPPLTNGKQHPYQKNEGTDLIFAIPAASVSEPGPPEPTAGARSTLSPVAVSDAIEVLDFKNTRGNPEDDWIGKTASNALFTALSEIPELKGKVFWSQFSPPARSEEEALRIARQRGMSKIIRGSVVVDGTEVRIDANIIDTETGASLGSTKKKGEREAILNLMDELALEMALKMQIEVSQAGRTTLQEGDKAKPERAKQLLEGEGVIAAPTDPTPNPHARGAALQPNSPIQPERSGAQSFLIRLVSPDIVYAAEPLADAKAEVERSLEEYRNAIERKDLDRLASFYVSFSDHQRRSVQAYFDNVDQLKVEISDVSVQPHGTNLEVSYTRHDRFIDRETGKPARLDVRLTKILTREGGKWRIAGGA